MGRLNPFKKHKKDSPSEVPMTQPTSATPTTETFGDSSVEKTGFTTITYQAVPIPKGYASPIGTVQVPQTPSTPAPQYTAQRSPLAGFTPIGSQFPRTPTGLTTPHDPKTPLSPTFQQERELDALEKEVEKRDKRDLRWKIRVRFGKVVLRSLNFACSLVVLSMIASTLAIFNATKNLAPRNSLPPWNPGTKLWPMIVVLVVACISLIVSSAILFAYWRGGHNRAEKLAIYWTVTAIATFVVAITMWAAVAGILNTTKATGAGKDLWGWSCKDNMRKILFKDDVNYTLVCRQVDWAFFCALIEIGLELLTIALYAFVFYRIASKRKLRKSMDLRDKQRNEIWLAKLREQEQEDPLTASNTAFNAKQGGDAGMFRVAEEGRSNTSQQTFKLQPAPLGNRARSSQDTQGSRSQLASPIEHPGPLPTSPFNRPNQTLSPDQPIPPTPRSVSFAAEPATPRNGSFPRESDQAAAVPPTPRSAMRSATPPEGAVPPTPRSVSFKP